MPRRRSRYDLRTRWRGWWPHWRCADNDLDSNSCANGQGQEKPDDWRPGPGCRCWWTVQRSITSRCSDAGRERGMDWYQIRSLRGGRSTQGTPRSCQDVRIRRQRSNHHLHCRFSLPRDITSGIKLTVYRVDLFVFATILISKTGRRTVLQRSRNLRTREQSR